MSQSTLTIICCDDDSGLALQLELWLGTEVVDDVHIVGLNDDLDDKAIDDLLALVGESKRDFVRLCVVRIEPGTGQFALEERMAERLEAACAIAEVEFVSGTICASSGTPYSVDDFHQGWSFSLVVVPHEGFGGRGFTDRPMQTEALPAAATLCVLLAAGSYSFMTEGTMDDARGIYTNDELAYRLVRCHLRLVDMGYQLDDVMATALTTSESWPEPTGTVPHPSPQQALARLVPKVQEPLRLAYDVPAPVPGARTRRVGFVAAIRLFFGQFVALVRRSATDAHYNAADGARDAVESLVQSATFGTHANTSISMLLDPESVEVLTSSPERAALVTTLPGIVAAPAIAQPNTWWSLRGLLFGLADGSDFPAALAGSELEERQQRAVITNPRDITVSPWQSNGKHDGPFYVSNVAARTLGFEDGEFYLHNNDARSALMLQSRLATRPRAAEGDSSTHTPVPSEESDTRSELSQDVNAWIHHRSHTLAWQLAVEQARSEKAAIEDLSATDQQLHALPEKIDEALDKFRVQRKRLFNFTLGSVGAALLLSLLAMYVGAAPSNRHLFGSPNRSDFDGLTGALLLAAIACGTIGFFLLVNATRKAMRLQERFEYLASLPPRLIKRRQACANECFRLGDLYQQLLDWLDVCGAILHRPFGEPGERSALSPIPTSSDFRNLVVGSGKRDNDKEAGLALELRRRAVSVGWLDRAYRNYLEAWSAWYQNTSGDDVTANPDTDTRTDEQSRWVPGQGDHLSSPRAELAARILRGSFDDWSYEMAAQSVRDSISAADALGLVRAVQSPFEPDGQSLDEFLGPLVVGTDEHVPPFELSYFAGDTLRSDLARVDKSYRGSHLQSRAEPMAGVDRQDLVFGHRSLFASYRFDVSQSLNVGQCALVDGSRNVERPLPAAQAFDTTDRG